DVAGAFKDGIGAVVNSSRGIMCAYKKQELDERAFAEAARAEAIRMRDDIMSVVK
ncbi:MAG: orotidine 5'-phosphate decarboxylase, partial [Massilioclostridium sp.]|nr:orotidine 5'-phosphate decarboxylase [Massilioclostridium sp.]